MTDAHRDIQPFVNQIEIAIVQHHFDLHLRVIIEKCHHHRRHHRRHVPAAELHRRSNAQQAAQLRFGGILHHRLIILQQLLRVLQQPHTRFGGRQPPGGALHQSGAETLFQRGDGPVIAGAERRSLRPAAARLPCCTTATKIANSSNRSIDSSEK